MEQVRLRISPRQLLYRRMKEAIRDSELSDEVPKDLFGCAEESTVICELSLAIGKVIPYVDD